MAMIDLFQPTSVRLGVHHDESDRKAIMATRVIAVVALVLQAFFLGVLIGKNL